MTEKEKLIIDFFDKLAKVSEIKNPLTLSKEFVKLESVIGDIYEKGYLKGFNEGKKQFIQDIVN